MASCQTGSICWLRRPRIRVTRSCWRDGSKSAVSYSIDQPGTRVGRPNVRFFSEDAFQQIEITLLEQVAGQIAIAIENACTPHQIALLKEQLESESIHVGD
jgi:GAF domain-containing protein